MERLAAVFRAFGDATRLALLQELKSGARSVNELQTALGTSQANISRQLKVLHEAGLLSRERRGAQVFYAISEPLVMDICRREAPFNIALSGGSGQVACHAAYVPDKVAGAVA